MSEVARFPFTDAKPGPPGSSLMPLLSLVLSHGERQRQAAGLLDTGWAVNVLPYALGEQLGFVWDEEKTSLALTGNLARLPARGIIVSASVGPFAPVRLVFAWTQADDVPLLLGQINFFVEFEVCFFRARAEFELKPKSSQ